MPDSSLHMNTPVEQRAIALCPLPFGSANANALCNPEDVLKRLGITNELYLPPTIGDWNLAAKGNFLTFYKTSTLDRSAPLQLLLFRCFSFGGHNSINKLFILSLRPAFVVSQSTFLAASQLKWNF